MKKKSKVIPLSIVLATTIGVAAVTGVSLSPISVSSNHTNYLVNHSKTAPVINDVTIKLDKTEYIEGEWVHAEAIVEPDGITGIEYVWYLDNKPIPKQEDKTQNKVSFPVLLNQKNLEVRIMYGNTQIYTKSTDLLVKPIPRPVVEEKKSNNTIIIVAGSIGGVILLGLILLFVALRMKRREENY